MSVSNLISPGLEIRSLLWKDDSFKMSDQNIGWADLSIPNPYVPGAFQTITFVGSDISASGVFGTSVSSITTNGDELTLPKNQAALRSLPYTVSTSSIYSINLRAKNDGTGTAGLTIILLTSTGSTITTLGATVPSSTYLHYTIKFNVSPPKDIAAIELAAADAGIIVDYIAFASTDFINQGGYMLDYNISKKTVPQRIPNYTDTIQQLGISSRTVALRLQKIQRASYNWLESNLIANAMLEFISPTLQATGYLTDVTGEIDAASISASYESEQAARPWVAVPLYDVSCTLIKGDVILQ
jgi:hypothetical protein